ncbi:DUF3795 domain-containing protein [Methanospirillum sp.]
MTPSIPLQQTARLIAPCGMNCALCLAFQRQKKRCPGCMEEDPNNPHSCQVCIIRNCPTILNNLSHFCYECENMPCKRLKQLDKRYRMKYGMSMIENLNEIKEKGMDVFLTHQVEKYACKTCGGLICVHRSWCLTCEP